jgi:hypothetical protein
LCGRIVLLTFWYQDIILFRKLVAAIPQRDQHLTDFNDFNDTLVAERLEEVTQWKVAIEGWEADRSQMNPFEVTTTSEFVVLWS